MTSKWKFVLKNCIHYGELESVPKLIDISERIGRDTNECDFLTL